MVVAKIEKNPACDLCNNDYSVEVVESMGIMVNVCDDCLGKIYEHNINDEEDGQVNDPPYNNLRIVKLNPLNVSGT